MKSKKTITGKILTFVSVLTGVSSPIILIILVIMLFTTNEWFLLPFILSTGFSICWFVLGELRLKNVETITEDTSIKIRAWSGKGSENIFDYKDFDGYAICKYPSRHKIYEYLFLIKDGKHLNISSEFYHENYSEIKEFITTKLPNKGEIPYTFLSEVKRIFTF